MTGARVPASPALRSSALVPCPPCGSGHGRDAVAVKGNRGHGRSHESKGRYRSPPLLPAHLCLLSEPGPASEHAWRTAPPHTLPTHPATATTPAVLIPLSIHTHTAAPPCFLPTCAYGPNLGCPRRRPGEAPPVRSAPGHLPRRARWRS